MCHICLLNSFCSPNNTRKLHLCINPYMSCLAWRFTASFLMARKHMFSASLQSYYIYYNIFKIALLSCNVYNSCILLHDFKQWFVIVVASKMSCKVQFSMHVHRLQLLWLFWKWCVSMQFYVSMLTYSILANSPEWYKSDGATNFSQIRCAHQVCNFSYC